MGHHALLTFAVVSDRSKSHMQDRLYNQSVLNAYETMSEVDLWSFYSHHNNTQTSTTLSLLLLVITLVATYRLQ